MHDRFRLGRPQVAVLLLLLCGTAFAARPGAAQGVAGATVPDGARLVLTRTVVAGEPVTASAVTLDGQPLAGVAVDVNGEEYLTDPAGRIHFVPPSGIIRLDLSLPGAVSAAGARAEILQWPADLETTGPPVVTEVEPFVMPGVELMLTGGPFESGRDGTTVTLDGEPLRVLSASPTRLIVATGFMTPLGEHELVVRAAGGGSEPVPITFLQLRLQASAEDLASGEKSTAVLWVEGTRREVCIRITNEAPDVAAFKDGNSFLVRSSGGRKNTVELKYTGVRPGHFAIRTEVVGEANRECRNP